MTSINNIIQNATIPPYPEARTREIIGIGNQSIVLANGHKKVLVITRRSVADNIELLRSVCKPGTYDANLLEIPQYVASNVDLAWLMNPKHPEVARKNCKEQFKVVYHRLWTENVVYEMPRYDGTLEDLKNIRFKEDSLTTLESTMRKTLAIFHKRKLSHNDVAERNIFFKGTYPNLQFYLGDFGSVSQNDAKTHKRKSSVDLNRLQRVMDKENETLKKKYHSPSGKSQYLQINFPSLTKNHWEKIGRSPEKIAASNPKKNSRSLKRKLFDESKLTNPAHFKI